MRKEKHIAERIDILGHPVHNLTMEEVIQRVDKEVIHQLHSYQSDELRVLVMPDHPTPIETRAHSGEPVPFVLWGAGFTANGGMVFSEAEAKTPGLLIDPGYNIISRLVGK